MTIWIVRRPHMRGVIACLIVAYNTPETVKPVTVSSFDVSGQGAVVWARSNVSNHAFFTFELPAPIVRRQHEVSCFQSDP